MKIIIDSAIPFVKGLFEPYAEVCYTKGDMFSAEEVRDADALIIRTRTHCNEALLAGSKVSIIASATIGYDHIDLDYCRQQGIKVTTAAGCNARGVLQWFSATIATLFEGREWAPSETTIGVVGVGNVGGLIAEYSRLWGFEVLCCDPPRAEREGGDFIELEELLRRSDIVTLHTPLNDSTRALLNLSNINLIQSGATIINSSRGECIDSEALRQRGDLRLALDVWEQEPNIDQELLQRAIVSTPHIAGYTLQGKANGSAMSVNAVARHLSIEELSQWYPDIERNRGERLGWESLILDINRYYDIKQETRLLKESPGSFEQMRNNYNYRSEFF